MEFKEATKEQEEEYKQMKKEAQLEEYKFMEKVMSEFGYNEVESKIKREFKDIV